MQAAARVDEERVLALASRTRQRPGGDLHGVALDPLLVDLGSRLRAHGQQLLDGGRPAGVAGGDRHRCRVLVAQVQRQLGRRRGLARPLQTRHQDHRGRARREAELGARASHQRGELLRDDLRDLLARRQAADHTGAQAALLQPCGELAHELEVDVRLEQGEANLAHRRIDVLLAERAAVAHARKRALQLLSE